MGFLDDAASVISGAPSKRSKSHRSSRHNSHHHSSRKDRSRSKSRSRSRSRHRHSSNAGGGLAGIAASVFGVGDDHDSDRKRHSKHSKHHDETSRSFFGGAFDNYNKHNASRSSFFSGFGGGSRSPSYYKRSPRPNFVSRVLKRLKRLLRDLVYYAKRHPVKVFMLVIMPLITGGALTALLAKFGLRLPAAVTSMMGLAGKAATGDSIGLVGEAVRMASGGLSGGGGSGSRGGGGGGGYGHTHATIERGRDGGMQWERRKVEQDGFGLGNLGGLASVAGLASGGGGGWGDGLKGITKMFS
ncbi:hypothetical protein B0H66DRAFT_37822 [Apodospora peruviana]|uniref:Uncharacterized protein n=1 Tax=Apodospora peruviana TaxID=516989 RepID=A0AAE0IRS3_9PEZI|nr:hypothetical protein B0H66DRAFT_37822 [Apodospora peruviana]